jgi:hypothetical protein
VTVSGDDVGERGEIIFRALMTPFDDRSEPRFKPVFLGEKHPGVDFLVRLNGARAGITPFFFAQIKATNQGYRPRDGRLRTRRLTREELRSIAQYPVPTYLFGIDVEPFRESAYILALNRSEFPPLNGFPTAHPVNAENRARLWDEVNQYWNRRIAFRSSFTDPGWGA